MSNAVRKLSRPSVFLLSEFVIIVLGVLVALAVDGWNQERQNKDIRRHLIASLLSDLNEDKGDYQEFVDHSKERVVAANFIAQLDAGRSELTEDQYYQAREALRILGSTSRLETVDNTFREMTAMGTGATIGDAELRLRISHYYGLARDRSDINDLLMPGILRYRESLEDIGISYVDRQQIDVDAVIENKKALAIIRELGYWADLANLLATDIRAENAELIAILEALQSR